jgi:hypothetical protein
MVSLFEPGRRKRCCLRCPCRCLPKAVLACLVILCMLSSFGCTLTEDMANLALDAPKTYKYATSTDAGERPSLDWWRGFHSVELTQLMEEAQPSIWTSRRRCRASSKPTPRRGRRVLHCCQVCRARDRRPTRARPAPAPQASPLPGARSSTTRLR